MAHRARFRNKAVSLLIATLSSCSGSFESDRMPTFEATTVTVHWQDGLAVENNQPFTGIVYTLAANRKDTVEVVGFRNGKEHGEWKRYYENGRLAEKRYFDNGQKTGDFLAWWPNGAPKLVYHFKDGEYEGTCREWSPTGMLLKEMTYKSGYEEGPQKQFYDNGKIKANYTITAGRRYGLLGTKNCVNATDSLFKR